MLKQLFITYRPVVQGQQVLVLGKKRERLWYNVDRIAKWQLALTDKDKVKFPCPRVSVNCQFANSVYVVPHFLVCLLYNRI